MEKMKQYTFREMENIVRKNGYAYVRTNGTHCVYKKDGVKKTIVLSKHRDVNACIARRLIKENNLIIKK